MFGRAYLLPWNLGTPCVHGTPSLLLHPGKLPDGVRRVNANDLVRWELGHARSTGAAAHVSFGWDVDNVVGYFHIVNGWLLRWLAFSRRGKDVELGVLGLALGLADGPVVFVLVQDDEEVAWRGSLEFKCAFVDFDEEGGAMELENFGGTDEGVDFPAFDIELDEIDGFWELGGDEVEGDGEEVGVSWDLVFFIDKGTDGGTEVVVLDVGDGHAIEVG